MRTVAKAVALSVVLVTAAACSSGPSQQEREDQFWTAYQNSLGNAVPSDPAAAAKLRAESIAFADDACRQIARGVSPSDIVSQGSRNGAQTDADLETQVTTAITYLCPGKP